MLETTLQAAGGRLPVSAYSPSAYGYSRGCMAALIIPLLEQRLQFCMGLDGGYDDEDGNHWVWQSAEDLRGWLADFHSIPASNDTVNRALAALTSTGRWIRAQLGRAFGHRSYYYRPAESPIPHEAELTPHLSGIDSAMERNHTETTSGTTTIDPERCAFSEPSDPSPQPERPHRERPVKRSHVAAPNLFEPEPWRVEIVKAAYNDHRAQERPAMPLADESHIEPVAEPLQLDSRPINDTVEPESVSATAEDSQGAALNALNTAKGRGWQFDAQRGQFRHRVLPMRRTVAEMARLHGVTEAQLLQALEGCHDARRA